MDGPGSLPVHGPQAVGARVATTDDDDVFASSGEWAGGHRILGIDGPVGQRQEIHGLVDTGQLPSGYRKFAPHRGSRRDHDGVVRIADLGCRQGSGTGPNTDGGA